MTAEIAGGRTGVGSELHGEAGRRADRGVVAFSRPCIF